MAPKDNRQLNLWDRWLRPRAGELFWDLSLWISIVTGLLLVVLPVALPFHLRCGVSVQSISNSVVSFAAIGLGVSVALGSLVVAFPPGNLRRAMKATNPRKGRSPYSDLAFIAFWAGIANLLAAAVALLALIVAGPYDFFVDSNWIPAAAGAAVLSSALYALLQMLAALGALLEAAGLNEAFDESD